LEKAETANTRPTRVRQISAAYTISYALLQNAVT
jgi:hypothetical protein